MKSKRFLLGALLAEISKKGGKVKRTGFIDGCSIKSLTIQMLGFLGLNYGA